MNGKIMIVDDEPDMLVLFEIIFRRKGFTVVTANGAQQALALLEKEKPELFIVDIMMPEVTGLELCERLRTRPDTAHTPIILFSALSSTDAVQQGFAAGADDVLPKTTPHNNVVSKVLSLLGRGNSQLYCAV